MDLYSNSFTPLELEFMAENSIVTISPTVSLSEGGGEGFQFLCGRFGPLSAGVHAQVPLWLALTLKESKKARLVMPEWLREVSLKAAIAYEETEKASFCPAIPFHYIEVAEMLLRVAEDDCAAECAAEGGSLETLYDTLRNLIEVREAKIHEGIAASLQLTKDPEQKDRTLVIRLNNVSAMEVADMRDGFLKVRRRARAGGRGRHARVSISYLTPSPSILPTPAPPGAGRDCGAECRRGHCCHAARDCPHGRWVQAPVPGLWRRGGGRRGRWRRRGSGGRGRGRRRRRRRRRGRRRGAAAQEARPAQALGPQAQAGWGGRRRRWRGGRR